MTDRIALGDRELDVMGMLWKAGSGTVSEVREKLDAALAYTTVLTILRNLEEKGVVGHAVEGKAHRYVPRLKQEDVRRSAIGRVVDQLFEGSAEELVLYLVRDGTISRKDLKKLRRAAKGEEPSGGGRKKAAKRDTIPVYKQSRAPKAENPDGAQGS